MAMMIFLFSLSSLAFTLVVSIEPPPIPPLPPTPQCGAADKVNSFGYKFFKDATNKNSGNVVFSPYSVYQVLALVSLATNEETKQQIETTLELNDGDLESLKIMGEALSKDGPLDEAKLSIANNGWVQSTCKLLESFKQKTKENFGVSFSNVNFAKEETTRLLINDWIAKKTGKRINEFYTAGAFNYMTQLVIANAIYFKGVWKTPFDEQRTRQGVFHGEAGLEIGNVHYMIRDGFYKVGEIDNVQVLELPYGAEEEYSMIIARPRHFTEIRLEEFDGNDIVDVTSLSKKMNAELLASWRESVRERQLEIHVPKFHFKKSMNLKSTLDRMGIKNLFTSKADLTAMTDDRNIFVTDARHKAFIEVDEKGTKAGAATDLEMGFLSIGDTLKIDRPFLFFIVHKECNTLVFSGKVTDPTKG